jgi:4-amino-4-deoxychorismate lyase
MEFVWYQGKICTSSDFQPGLQSRAALYGDGLFETMVGEGDEIRYLDLHLSRMQRGLKALRMLSPYDLNAESLLSAASALASREGLGSPFRIRLDVWRSSGGFYTPTQQNAEWSLRVMPFKPAAAIKPKAIISRYHMKEPSPVSFFKNLNALVYVLAGIEAQEQAADEVILLNRDGQVVEAGASNLFWLKNNTLYTPSTDTGCIEGIMRQRILQKASENGYAVSLGLFSPLHLREAELLFTANVTGLSLIKHLEGKDYDARWTPELTWLETM